MFWGVGPGLGCTTDWGLALTIKIKRVERKRILGEKVNYGAWRVVVKTRKIPGGSKGKGRGLIRLVRGWLQDRIAFNECALVEGGRTKLRCGHTIPDQGKVTIKFDKYITEILEINIRQILYRRTPKSYLTLTTNTK